MQHAVEASVGQLAQRARLVVHGGQQGLELRDGAAEDHQHAHEPAPLLDAARVRDGTHLLRRDEAPPPLVVVGIGEHVGARSAAARLVDGQQRVDRPRDAVERRHLDVELLRLDQLLQLYRRPVGDNERPQPHCDEGKRAEHRQHPTSQGIGDGQAKRRIVSHEARAAALPRILGLGGGRLQNRSLRLGVQVDERVHSKIGRGARDSLEDGEVRCALLTPEYGYVLDERRAGRALELHVHRVCDQLERAELTCARVAAGLEADLAGIVEAEPTKVVVRIHV